MALSTSHLVFPIRLTKPSALEGPRAGPTSAGEYWVAELTRELAAGKEEAFLEFHARYFARLFQLLLVVTRGNEQEAQEALQQTLLRVVRYARAFESEEAFWSWLKVLARSAARDAGRKQQRYFRMLQHLALNLQAAPQGNTQTESEQAQLHSVLTECLEEMGPEEAELLQRKYIQGETVKELSARFAVSEKAVESRLVRLRRELRERILRKLQEK